MVDGALKHARRAGGRALLDARPHGRPRPRDAARRPLGEGVLRAAAQRTSRTATRGCSTGANGIPTTWPAEAKGVGMTRGAARRPRALDRDQGRQDRQLPARGAEHLERARRATAKGQRSAYEAALVGTPVANPDQPLEMLRTIHSFDPCIACAVHLLRRAGALRAPGVGRSRGGAPWQTHPIQRVYVWELPVRLYHWVNAASRRGARA